MTQVSKPKAYLKPSEVATLLRVEPGTVGQWARAGQLRFTHTPGRHRRFLYRDVLDFARRHDLSLAVPEGETIRVLIVDDDAPVRTMLLRTLDSVDRLETEAVNDGFSAGRRMSTFLPHVVLMDLFMPGLNGVELCRAIKSDPATVDVRIIAMTGAADSAVGDEVLRLGAEQCLSKPVTRPELLAAIGVA